MWIKSIVLTASILTLSACGGGDGETTPSELQGVFLDSAVAGLAYSSGSLSGTTGAEGSFLYEQGATITFKVGDIVVGTANGQAVMTPVSLVPGAVDENDPTVTNIVQFLLTIDDDGDPANGIQITPAISTAATGQSLDFTLNDFDTNPNVLNVIALLTSGTSTLVSELVAQTHLNDTLLSIMAGIYNGTFSGDIFGTWTIVVNTDGTITGSGCDALEQLPFFIAGTVSSDGASALGFAGDGSYTGNFSLTGEFSGTWTVNSGVDNGSFTGLKASTSVGGSCTN